LRADIKVRKNVNFCAQSAIFLRAQTEKDRKTRKKCGLPTRAGESPIRGLQENFKEFWLRAMKKSAFRPKYQRNSVKTAQIWSFFSKKDVFPPSLRSKLGGNTQHLRKKITFIFML